MGLMECMGKKESESEKEEKINGLLEFLKEEKREKLIKERIKNKDFKDKSIKESFRHEDFMYYAFLYGFLGVLVSLVLYYGNLGLNIFIGIILPIIILILIFSMFRFFGIILEDNFWRFISLHGLITFLVAYFILPTFWVFMYFSIELGSYLGSRLGSSLESELRYAITVGIRIAILIVILYLLLRAFKFLLGKTNDFAKTKLYETTKYRFKKEDRVILDDCITYLGSFLFFLFASIVTIYALLYPKEELNTYEYISFSILFVFIIFWAFFELLGGFYRVKNGKKPLKFKKGPFILKP